MGQGAPGFQGRSGCARTRVHELLPDDTTAFFFSPKLFSILLTRTRQNPIKAAARVGIWAGRARNHFFNPRHPTVLVTM